MADLHITQLIILYIARRIGGVRCVVNWRRRVCRRHLARRVCRRHRSAGDIFFRGWSSVGWDIAGWIWENNFGGLLSTFPPWILFDSKLRIIKTMINIVFLIFSSLQAQVIFGQHVQFIGQHVCCFYTPTHLYIYSSI